MLEELRHEFHLHWESLLGVYGLFGGPELGGQVISSMEADVCFGSHLLVTVLGSDGEFEGQRQTIAGRIVGSVVNGGVEVDRGR